MRECERKWPVGWLRATPRNDEQKNERGAALPEVRMIFNCVYRMVVVRVEKCLCYKIRTPYRITVARILRYLPAPRHDVAVVITGHNADIR